MNTLAASESRPRLKWARGYDGQVTTDSRLQAAPNQAMAQAWLGLRPNRIIAIKRCLHRLVDVFFFVVIPSI